MRQVKSDKGKIQIIPTINCKDFKCVKEKLEIVTGFLPKGGWVQIDISDGKFTKVKGWNEPKRFKKLVTSNQKSGKLRYEIHLMVNDWEKEAKKWLEAGADRVLVHVEALNKLKTGFTPFLKGGRGDFKKIGIALNSDTEISEVIPFLDKIKFVQLLAVKPGYSGQEFNKRILKKIRDLKKIDSKIIIEVDGGINLKIARLCKKAGADILVSGSYIFDSKNPQENYEKLKSV